MIAVGDRILLTADRTLMSEYHHNIFVGFGTCSPPNVIPDWLYKRLFFPPIKTKDGIPVAAPYGLRKIEAQLLSEGFNVLTVDPDHLGKYIDEAKVLGIHVMDPFGIGPASSTLAAILKKEPFLAQYFHVLMEKPEIQEAKNRGLRIIIGGPGVWQFKYRPEFVKEHGIDCIIAGEAEKVVGKIFRATLDNDDCPQYYEVLAKETPSSEVIAEKEVEFGLTGLFKLFPEKKERSGYSDPLTPLFFGLMSKIPIILIGPQIEFLLEITDMIREFLPDEELDVRISIDLKDPSNAATFKIPRADIILLDEQQNQETLL